MAKTTGTRSLADLIAQGILFPDEHLVINRRSAAAVAANLQPDGTILLDGDLFLTPSSAARHALDLKCADGWLRWRVPRLGDCTLARLRDAPASDDLALPKVDGGFGTVLADPPWRFLNRTGKVAPEHKRLSRYETMDAKEIAALPINEIVAAKSHCYLWVPNALLADGLMVMEQWGFTYKANIVWAKRRKDGGPDGRGVGFYFRNVTELILFGVKGGLRTGPKARSMVNMIETQKREHSRKPDEQYDIIEAVSPGPYLELFARYPRIGWAVWGNEADAGVVPRGKQYAAYGAARG